MCGISGFIKLSESSPLGREQLTKMNACMIHRGPDNQGFFMDDFAGLAHNRLSIIDLNESANQPMEYGPLRIVFNGEIYNYRELKEELIALGNTFTTKSDTEVILAAYTQWGTHSFIKLNGVFSFVIYDTQHHKAVIARDRFGVKPLYYYHDRNHLLFASEIKSMLAAGVISKELNYAALNEYMHYVSPMGDETFFRNIYKVSPGQFIKVSQDGVKTSEYWNIPFGKTCNDPEDIAVEKIRILLEKAVERQLVSDVPVSVFLSGGIDSSAITTFAAKHYKGQLHSYSVAFDFNRGGKSELEMAAKVAHQNHTQHHEITITSENLEETVEFLAIQHDEPFADAANIPLYLLTRELKKDIRVVLQGDGGDELFGGYNYYNLFASASKYRIPALIYRYTLGQFSIPHPLFEKMRRISYAMSEPDPRKKIGLLVTGTKEYDKPLSSLHPEIRALCEKEDPFAALKKLPVPEKDMLQLMHWADLKTILPNDYLEKVDKPTMANSIEVRVPFLDNELADYVISLPASMKTKNGEQKYLLKKALRGMIPDEILDGKKRGFGVPYIEWLQTGLNKKMKDTLLDPVINEAKLFDREEIIKKIAHLDAGHKTHGTDLWRCLNLALWYKHYML